MSETRHQFLRRTISQRIRGLSAGSRLSTEHEFCAEFQVSRMTVNKVLCELEKEGLVKRIRHHGTFVQGNQRSGRVVTFLLPSPDNLVINNNSSLYRRSLLSGALEAVRVSGSRLETLPVSPTNNAKDIDFTSLRHLSAGSLVIVSNCWYANIFAALHEQACRVCLLDDQVLYSFLKAKKYTEDWLIGTMDVKQAVHDLVLRLYRQGCRRIAILSPFLQYPGHPRMEGYRDAIRENGLPELVFIQERAIHATLTSPEMEFLSAHQCDGVVLDASELIGLTGDNLNQAIGLPESILPGAFFFHPDMNFLLEQPQFFQFDYEKMGYDSVMRLIADDMKPIQQTYPAIFSTEE